ncbi:MAG: hypothetical protein OER12_08730 [Acidimicrobiia bacterium]|nr:hypothetical protein [Acidimicrobiia bacterium]
MRAVFGLALAVGFLAVLGWIAAVAVADSVDGWEGVDPDARFGLNGRRVVAGVLGFGMAGLSAAYAGWPIALAIGAAVAGALAAGLLAASR